jgi:signal transduction histidine kinase
MAARKGKKKVEPPPPDTPDVESMSVTGAAPDDPRYNVAFEFAMDCQIVTDVRGLILNVNHAGVKFLQMEKRFLVNKPLGLLFAGSVPNSFYNRLAQFNHGMDSCSFESKLNFPHSGPRDVLVIGILHTLMTIRWVIHDTTAWKQAEAARTFLLRQLITTQSTERRRLSRDLHDNVGQLLTGLTFALGAVERDTALSENGREALALAQNAANELRRAIHDITHGLRSSLLEENSLGAALQQLITEWKAREPAIGLRLRAETIEEFRLPREVESNVFSIVQEALTNVYRHAKAHNISVVVERGDQCLIAMIKDDGVGFDAELAAHQSGLGRLGLVGMRERAALVGGDLEIYTKSGNGTVVSASIPVPPADLLQEAAPVT